jgi:hypothetical protein
VTVLPAGRLIVTVPEGPGTVPLDQFDAVSQSPPAALVQEIAERTTRSSRFSSQGLKPAARRPARPRSRFETRSVHLFFIEGIMVYDPCWLARCDAPGNARIAHAGAIRIGTETFRSRRTTSSKANPAVISRTPAALTSSDVLDVNLPAGQFACPTEHNYSV